MDIDFLRHADTPLSEKQGVFCSKYIPQFFGRHDRYFKQSDSQLNFSLGYCLVFSTLAVLD